MKQRILMKTKGRICVVKIEPINTSLVSFSAGSNVNLLLPRSLFYDLPPKKKKSMGLLIKGRLNPLNIFKNKDAFSFQKKLDLKSPK